MERAGLFLSSNQRALYTRLNLLCSYAVRTSWSRGQPHFETYASILVNSFLKHAANETTQWTDLQAPADHLLRETLYFLMLCFKLLGYLIVVQLRATMQM